ncbi:MAG: competence/damage-inducible protein A [Bacteroidetes bacterium]|nr:competence/damage-inducible protein A [Bacteroidota bacterium]
MNPVHAEIITIGDEILYGQIIDTNSQWMSEALDEIGVRTIRKTTVGDNEKAIIAAFQEAFIRADLVLITGGLGPTHDDITKKALADYFDCPISINPQALAEIRVLFEKRGFILSETNKQQAALPEKCEMISNKNGSAPGMWFEQEGKVFVSMPGVPHEMKGLMKEAILPRIEKEFHTSPIFHKIIKTSGIGESWLADKIQPWVKKLPSHIKLAYLPGLGEVKLRLTASGKPQVQLESDIATQIEQLIPLAGKYIYGFDQDTLQKVIGQLMTAQGKSISVAESCSGGYVAHLITSIPGSSNYFKGGVVAYDDQIKIDVLGVKVQTLEDFGAVSEETVTEMAKNVRKRFKTDIGIAISGIAGPDGGTDEKPVGTIWITLADGHSLSTKKLTLGKLRDVNIKYSSNALLRMVWQTLIQNN